MGLVSRGARIDVKVAQYAALYVRSRGSGFIAHVVPKSFSLPYMILRKNGVAGEL